MYAGIDVGARRWHVALVRIGGGPDVVASVQRLLVESPADSPVDGPGGLSVDGAGGGRAEVAGLAELVDLCAGVARVAVDAPGALSCGAHLDDAGLAPKFRTGRCSEVPVPGWPPVPWITPATSAAAPGWMISGFRVWSALTAAGHEVVETFPAAFFHRLNGSRWPPPKSTAAGRAARLALLSRLVELPATAAQWGHDEIDAVACALVAGRGGPTDHACKDPDGSVMWVLP